jgi:hypothetical protein
MKHWGFALNTFALYLYTTCCIWDANEEEASARELLFGNVALKWLSLVEMETIHLYIVSIFVAIKALYMLFLKWATCWWKAWEI